MNADHIVDDDMRALVSTGKIYTVDDCYDMMNKCITYLADDIRSEELPYEVEAHRFSALEHMSIALSVEDIVSFRDALTDYFRR